MYLKKLINRFMLLVVCIFLAGCDRGNITPEKETTMTSVIEETETVEHTEAVEETEAAEHTEVLDNYVLLDKEFSGNIRYAGEDNLMLLGNNLILVDCNTHELKKKSEDLEEGFSFYDFWDYDLISSEEGYIVIGNRYVSQESMTYLTIVYFDKDLKLEQVIDVEEQVGFEHSVNAYELFDNGEKLIFSTIKGTFLYDFITEKLENLSSENIEIDYFSFLTNTKQILFTGYQYEDNGLSYRCFGRMGLDGNGLMTEEEEAHLWGRIWCYEDFALIAETDVYGKANEKLVFCYDRDGIIHDYPLSDSNENFHIYPSRKGEYYATKTRTKGEGYMIRLYASMDGHLVWEIPMTYDEYGENLRILQVLVCERTNKIIFLAEGLELQKESFCLIFRDF